MFWTKKKPSISVDEQFGNQIKKFQLKQRAIKACQDTTDYELQLRHFLENNQNNILLLTNVVGYRSYLLRNGCTNQTAAKETLEYYRH